MKSQATTAVPELLPQKPSVDLATSIATGMRWTLWLSLLALPFGYLTNILLARIGPEALGTFGVLNVYIGLVYVFFFLGGCAVPMKFLPALDNQRRGSFLASYGLILLAGLVPWFLLVMLRPQWLRIFFGTAGDPDLQVRLVYLSPVCLAYLLMITSLRGVLDMKWAQILDRCINIGQATTLLVAFLWSRTWLTQHAAAVVWLTYVGLTGLVAVLAFFRLRHSRALAGLPRLWLPAGFWKYSALLQSSSVLNFLNTKLDYLFVLNAGGLEVLGNYVAITAVAGIVPRVSGFIVDSLLPSITNCLAVGDSRSASRVAGIYLRLMFPTVLGASFAVIAFVRPVLAIMGAEYGSLAPFVQVAAVVAGMQSINLFSSAVLTATDRVQHDIAARVVRTVLFAAFFWPLWTSMRLNGAVISWGLGELGYQIVSFYLLSRNPSVHIQWRRSYVAFVGALAASIIPARYGLEAEYVAASVLLALLFVGFLLVASYSTGEIRGLASLVTRARAASLPA